ncbi:MULTISPECIES: hypothetical protein [Lysobacter]|uniref:Uncharacterized protein n=1 Tax=Lysobacter firmicutimachus TaxID=1792846 RepID=A0ABU8D3K0_9GAMM|nr:hypothetical protein [Lysobacter antibioticus]
MSDARWPDRRFRTFNVNDDLNRESMKIDIDSNLPSANIVRVLDELVEVRGAKTIARGKWPGVHQRRVEALGQARGTGPVRIRHAGRGPAHGRGLAPPLQPSPPAPIAGRPFTTSLRDGELASHLYFQMARKKEDASVACSMASGPDRQLVLKALMMDSWQRPP